MCAATEPVRSEEHTSELQSHLNLVCRLLLEKQHLHEAVRASLLESKIERARRQKSRMARDGQGHENGTRLVRPAPAMFQVATVFFVKTAGDHLDLHSFPTRRSSD